MREGSFKEDMGLNHSDSHFTDSKGTACCLRVTSASLKVESRAGQAVRAVCFTDTHRKFDFVLSDVSSLSRKALEMAGC